VGGLYDKIIKIYMNKEAINHCRFQKTGIKQKSTASKEVCLAAIALPGIEC